eukprot:scaffold33658_cov58-Cyclotella_meneghiniana.AAC.2
MRTFAYAVVRASSEPSCSCDSIAILCQFEIDSPPKANFHPASFISWYSILSSIHHTLLKYDMPE